MLVYRENGTVKFLTKGDNNSVDDRGLYAPGQLWLTKNDIVGRARGVLPYVGMITIYMNEYPNFKVSTSQIKLNAQFYRNCLKCFCSVSVCYLRSSGIIRTFAPRVSYRCFSCTDFYHFDALLMRTVFLSIKQE